MAALRIGILLEQFATFKSNHVPLPLIENTLIPKALTEALLHHILRQVLESILHVNSETIYGNHQSAVVGPLPYRGNGINL